MAGGRSRSKETLLNYELPATIQSIQDGWQFTCQIGTVVSALLAVVAAQLLSFFKDPRSYDQTKQSAEGLRTTLILFCYASLILNISASISSFILIDRLGELPFRAAQKPQSILPSGGSIHGTSEDLLRRYGVGSLWTIIMWHWLISYGGGIISILVQILLYIWLQESRAVQITVTCITAFAVLPLVSVALVPWIQARRRRLAEKHERDHEAYLRGFSLQTTAYVEGTRQTVPEMPPITSTFSSTEHTQV